MWAGLAARPWLIVPVCAAMHLTFAVGYFLDHSIGKITALHAVDLLFGVALPFVCLLTAISALIPMFFVLPALTVHLCLWPQQFLLFLMAYSAVSASWLGQYPDGYRQSFIFIFADQCVGLYLMIAHFTALWRNARLVNWSR